MLIVILCLVFQYGHFYTLANFDYAFKIQWHNNSYLNLNNTISCFMFREIQSGITYILDIYNRIINVILKENGVDPGNLTLSIFRLCWYKN